MHPTRQWLNGHTVGLCGLDFSSDDRLLASSGSSGRICVHETGEGRLIDTLALGDHSYKLGDVKFGANVETLFAYAFDPTDGLFVWNRRSSTPYQLFPTRKIWRLSVAPGGATMATAFAGQGVALWDTVTLTRLHNVVDEPQTFTNLQFSPDGRCLAASASSSPSELLRLVDVQTGASREVSGTNAQVNGMCFDREGRRLAVISDGRMLQLIDVATAMVTDSFHLEPHSGIIDPPCFSPDGEVLAFGSYGAGGRQGCVQLFHLKARRTVLTLDTNKLGGSLVQFSHDGRMLATIMRAPDRDGNAGIFLWRFDPPRAARPSETSKLQSN